MMMVMVSSMHMKMTMAMVCQIIVILIQNIVLKCVILQIWLYAIE
jgi:hypothetical protein